jgi:hypothetical protein
MGQPKLAYKDESTGQGDSAVNGDVLKVSFVGKVFPSGAQFAKNDDFVFELGEGKTLPGFDTALLGTQAGTKRLIRVPPSMAYGKQGMPVRYGLLLPVVGNKAFVVVAATQGTLYCHDSIVSPFHSRCFGSYALILTTYSHSCWQPRIPPNADLEFEIEVKEITRDKIQGKIAKFGAGRLLGMIACVSVLALSPMFG